jgi:retron-type reverse transcriptase
MIDKWLKAGVLEDGLLRHATEGSPQGGVISPCLSNIFLHHVTGVRLITE